MFTILIRKIGDIYNGLLNLANSKDLTGNHLAEAMYDVDNEEGAPAEEEDPHDDADRDGGLVLLHQAVGDLTRGSLVVNSQDCRLN